MQRNKTSMREILEVSPDQVQIDPILGNLRRHGDPEEDEGLEASIRVEGLMQAIGVRRIPSIDPSGLYLVFGGRRLAAARRAGVEKILVRDLGPIDDLTALVLQIVENDQRVAVHPLDDARAIAHLVRRAGTQAEAARRTGRSEATISILRRIGEAVELLSPEELRRLYDSPALTVRSLHAAVRPTIGGREAGPEVIRRRLLEIAARDIPARPGRPSGKKTSRQRMNVQAFERGGGMRFTVRWTDRDLATNPDAFIRDLVAFLEERLREIAERATALQGTKGRTTVGRSRTPPKTSKPKAKPKARQSKPLYPPPPAELPPIAAIPHNPASADDLDDAALFDRVDALIRNAEKRLEHFRTRWKEWEQRRPRKGS